MYLQSVSIGEDDIIGVMALALKLQMGIEIAQDLFQVDNSSKPEPKKAPNAKPAVSRAQQAAKSASLKTQPAPKVQKAAKIQSVPQEPTEEATIDVVPVNVVGRPRRSRPRASTPPRQVKKSLKRRSGSQAPMVSIPFTVILEQIEPSIPMLRHSSDSLPVNFNSKNIYHEIQSIKGTDMPDTKEGLDVLIA